MSEHQRIVVVGAGHSASALVASLRQWGHPGEIQILGDEPEPPYQRPPLSKSFLKGQADEADLYLRPSAFYEKAEVSLCIGRRVNRVVPSDKIVTLDDGSMIAYDKLVIATGTRPRTIAVPGTGLSGVLSLRTLADARRLRGLVQEGKRLVVVGAGYIGLETAAVARGLGLSVTVLEAGERVLARVTSVAVSEFYQELHESAGVEIRLEQRLIGFHGTGAGEVCGVELADGEVLPADIVLTGVGVIPNVEIAEAAGLTCDDGITTDREARTSDPDIYAIGDCANRTLVQYGVRGRLESVHNAVETAKIAAASMCNRPAPRVDAPWFWSDQYDVKLQTAGLFTGYDSAIVRGNAESRSFSVWYLRDSRLLAVDAVNSPAEFMAGKVLVGRDAVLDPVRIADPATDVRDLVSAARAAGSTTPSAESSASR